jgi:gamma-glutamyl:cysteine ligase YbdK (ATP-grasp superfamily)
VFAAIGIELEYMIVDAATLDVRPVAERALAELAGRPASDVARGALGWSNELVSHVVELKNLSPSASLAPLADAFGSEIVAMDRALAPFAARLMPTGMHPWMDPRTETRLWSRDGAPIYRAFDRVFDCRRHGWANLQSMHVNLPFAGDLEFRRLHAAIRVALPLIPALAASSPLADGCVQRSLDHRLDLYATHAARVPSISGRVVPEPVESRRDYETGVLATIYRDVAPLDPDRVLRHEWLNARGAIARFDRSAIEIRLADVQECPRADLAIAAAVTALVRALYEERWSDAGRQNAVSTQTLAGALAACVADAERAWLDDGDFLALFGVATPCNAAALWAHAIAAVDDDIDADAQAVLAAILDRGPLARRIVEAAGVEPSRERLGEVYARLCDCLAHGRLFSPGGR